MDKLLIFVLNDSLKKNVNYLHFTTWILVTGKSLEDAIESECSGNFKRVLVAIIQGCRQKGCNEAQARIDAQELFEAGEE